MRLKTIGACIAWYLLASPMLAQQEFELVEPALLESFVAEQAAAVAGDVVPAANVEAVSTSNVAADAGPAAADERLSKIDKSIEELKKSTSVLSKFKVGALMQADAWFYGQDAQNQASYGDIQNGIDFRRARMALQAQLTDNSRGYIEMDFGIAARPAFMDVYLEQTAFPVLGSVRAGQWLQPFTLEGASGIKQTLFFERSLPFLALAPFRRLGVGFYNHSEDDRVAYAGSIIASGQDLYGGSIGDVGGIGYTQRLTFLPYYDEAADGRYYFNWGVSHWLNAPANKNVTFRTQPESFVGADNGAGGVGSSGQPVFQALNGTPFLVSAAVSTDVYNTFGGEFMWSHGPLAITGESYLAVIDPQSPAAGAPAGTATNGPVAMLPGFYLQAGYFLTGEHRPFDKVTHTLGRIQPFENFFRIRGEGNEICSGLGAIEIGNRISFLDLNDKTINGGQIADYTFGVNWYWNPSVRFSFNYIHTWVNPGNPSGTVLTYGPGSGGLGPTTPFAGPSSNLDAVGFRAQMDF